ncbi:MAG TPA: TVP38/TMEM64 family protein [Candidatus Pacearchaeota archaeon]|nr:TVP38/TMEM64 family protein [Candidatus Pacearchaeota archaeon]
MAKGVGIKRFFKENWIIILIVLLLIGSFAYSYFSKGVIYSISNSDSNSIVEFINSFGAFSYFVFLFVVILEVIFAPIPALALYLAGGALFGAFFGGILTLIGNLIGALIAFLLARRFGRKFVEKKVDKKMREKFDKFSQKYGIFSLFLLRINPLTTSDLFSYLAGLTKISVKTFLIGTGLGLAPMIFAHTYFGQTFVSSHPALYIVLVWISILYLLVFFYLIFRAIRKNKVTSH